MSPSEDLFAPEPADPGTEAGRPGVSASSGSGRARSIGRAVGVAIVAGAVLLSFTVFLTSERHPRSDDAIVQADIVRIAPMVSGHIVELAIRDGQAVKAGDLLFVIDPRPYELALERVVAEKALVESEIEQMARDIEAAEAGAQGARANLERVRYEHELASKTLNRLEPLLTRGFVTAETVDGARMANRASGASMTMARRAYESSVRAVPMIKPLETRLLGVETSTRAAELDLRYTRVVAPVDGRVAYLNIAKGSFAAIGIPVFVLIDTSNWYVSANFRETELKHIRPGMRAEIYVMIDPDKRFTGTVENIGWAVHSEDEFDLFGIPFIQRTLNWVRLAQRFPVRIRVDDPRPAELFRMGASAVVTIRP